jgi:hypothetical protein
MFEVRARNVHQALPLGLHLLYVQGVARQSRNGPVTMLPEPVATHYEKPCERVLFHPARDANPFFHLMESLWMVAGRNDVEFPCRYVKTMKDFSDDGKTFHGAYGNRWRNWFGYDQLETIIASLDTNPDDRRCVLSMWDATQDLGQPGKDFPCNLTAVFGVGGHTSETRRLNMTVYNRSNDMVWGAYGANAVHFSFLQEYVASCLGLKVGWYEQVTCNMHAYEKTHAQVAALADDVDPLRGKLDPYQDGEVEPYPIMSVDKKTWDEDLSIFMEQGPITGFREPFFRQVVTPIYHAHEAYKAASWDRYEIAKEILKQCAASDWRKACIEWVERREEKALAKH